MQFLTIQESAEVTGKSESTIKRFVREIKSKNPKKYSDSKCFRFEKLPTGHKKILISLSFLQEKYSTVQTDRLNGSNEHFNSSDSQELVSFLKEQLREKDKVIETLLERNKEVNILFAQSQQNQTFRLEADTTKKRWWQRKK